MVRTPVTNRSDHPLRARKRGFSSRGARRSLGRCPFCSRPARLGSRSQVSLSAWHCTANHHARAAPPERGLLSRTRSSAGGSATLASCPSQTHSSYRWGHVYRRRVLRGSVWRLNARQSPAVPSIYRGKVSLSKARCGAKRRRTFGPLVSLGHALRLQATTVARRPITFELASARVKSVETWWEHSECRSVAHM